MLEVTLTDAGDDYTVRFACPCGNPHCDDEPLHVNVDQPLPELVGMVEERFLSRYDAFVGRHAGGLRCAACSETSTLKAPILQWWCPEWASSIVAA